MSCAPGWCKALPIPAATSQAIPPWAGRCSPSGCSCSRQPFLPSRASSCCGTRTMLPTTAEEVLAAAATLSMTFTLVPVRRAEELDGALAAMMLERPDGVMVTGDAIHQLHVGRIINFLANNRLPGLFQYRENVVAGGLMSYGASLPELFPRAAGYVDKILRGTRPADLPLEQPTKFELVVNLKTAKALGLTIPEPFLLLADEIIE